MMLLIESLPDEWVDADIVMLHACFQLLKDFVEKELELDETRDSEVLELYDWWMERAASNNDEQDNIMLERLIKIRERLWT